MDPYSVLGVSPDASDEEIRKVYKELVRKFHPDNYHDSPLAEWAQNKMKEINKANDEITKMRQGGGGHYGGGSRAASGGSGVYNLIRAAINRGKLDEAERLLSGIAERNAEWHFLMGSVCYRRGWLDEARRYFQTACNMNPQNPEYREALNYMNHGGAAYRPPQYRDMGGMDMCDCCAALACANCLCGGCGH